MIGAYLKKADQYIKEEDFDAAEKVVAEALSLDPKNLYALAYKERIRNARKAFEERGSHAERPSPAPTHAVPPKPEPVKPIPPVTAKAAPISPAVPSEPDAEDVIRYRALLKEAWADGSLTPLEQSNLRNLRSEISLSDDEHLRMESEIKSQCFIESVRDALQQGLLSGNPDLLNDLRTRFSVTLEEYLRMESKLFTEMQKSHHKATIFFADDDILIVELMQTYLTNAGFTVVVATTPEGAMQKLHTIVPDLILCDMKFPDSPHDGLWVYEQVRKIPELVAVPFIFLTAVRDDRVFQSSLQIGVDGYLTKPFGAETLLATIRGKLKRYQELKSLR